MHFWAPSMHKMYRRTCRQNTHTQKNKTKISLPKVVHKKKEKYCQVKVEIEASWVGKSQSVQTANDVKDAFLGVNCVWAVLALLREPAWRRAVVQRCPTELQSTCHSRKHYISVRGSENTRVLSPLQGHVLISRHCLRAHWGWNVNISPRIHVSKPTVRCDDIQDVAYRRWLCFMWLDLSWVVLVSP